MKDFASNFLEGVLVSLCGCAGAQSYLGQGRIVAWCSSGLYTWRVHTTMLFCKRYTQRSFSERSLDAAGGIYSILWRRRRDRRYAVAGSGEGHHREPRFTLRALVQVCLYSKTERNTRNELVLIVSILRTQIILIMVDCRVVNSENSQIDEINRTYRCQ